MTQIKIWEWLEVKPAVCHQASQDILPQRHTDSWIKKKKKKKNYTKLTKKKNKNQNKKNKTNN